ncbi:aminoglycoside phosphotransferase family protein [Planctomycetota bacterium]
MLPSIPTLADYRKVHGRSEVWDGAVRAICERHGRPFSEYRLTRVGTHVVYQRPGSDVVKLYCPLFPEDFLREKVVLEHLHGQLAVPMPEILFGGQLDGWSYLGISYLPGSPIETVWPRLDRADQLRLAAQIGEVLAEWHRLPLDDLDELDRDWRSFIREQIEACAATQRRRCPSAPWLEGLSDYLEAAVDDPFAMPERLVLLNADVTGEHVLVEEKGSAWRISGLIDFGDCMLGHAEYDFVAAGIDALHTNGEAQHAMLRAFGYSTSEISEQLRARLMAWTLLHEFADLGEILDHFRPPRPPRTMHELASVLWPLPASG